MKKSLSRMLALALTAALVLSGCGGTGTTTESESSSTGKQENASAETEGTEESSADEITTLPSIVIAAMENTAILKPDFSVISTIFLSNFVSLG